MSYEPIARTGRGGGRGGGGGGIRGSSRARASGGFNLEGGAPAETAVIRGYDFTVLQMIAEDLAFRLEEVEEIDPTGIQPDAERGAPEVHVLPDEAIMSTAACKCGTVLNAVGDANPRARAPPCPFSPRTAPEIPIEIRNVKIRKKRGRRHRGLAPNPDPRRGRHALAPVRSLACASGPSRSMILAGTDQSRARDRVLPVCRRNLASQPLLDAARAYVQDVVAEMVVPTGYAIEIVEAEEETIYYWMIGIAALLIFMILASLFESLSAPLIILCTLPTAIIGSCWALILSGTGLASQEAPMAILGFIVLLGIAVNNGIVLIDAISTRALPARV